MLLLLIRETYKQRLVVKAVVKVIRNPIDHTNNNKHSSSGHGRSQVVKIISLKKGEKQEGDIENIKVGKLFLSSG